MKSFRRTKKSKRARRNARKGSRRWVVKQLINREGGLCQDCKQQVNLKHMDPLQASVDHEIPVSKGGSDQLHNMRLTCRACNEKKADSMPDDL